MGVLARELASYQSAVDQYQRNAQGFNSSLLEDANGNILIFTNGQYYTVPMSGGNATPFSGTFTTKDGKTITGDQLASYGMTASSGDPNVQLLRQNPTGSTTNTVTGLRAVQDEYGNTSYYTVDFDGNYAMYTPKPGTVVKYEMVPASNPEEAPTYKAIETQYQYIGEPGDFTRKPPDPTNAQIRRMNQGTWADAERLSGLDNGIIMSGGLKGGLRPPPKPVDGIDTGITDPPPPPELEPDPVYDWTSTGA